MKTLDYEVEELKKLFTFSNTKELGCAQNWCYLDANGWAISDYTMGQLDALCHATDDEQSRNRLYYFAELFGFVPKVKVCTYASDVFTVLRLIEPIEDYSQAQYEAALDSLHLVNIDEAMCSHCFVGINGPNGYWSRGENNGIPPWINEHELTLA